MSKELPNMGTKSTQKGCPPLRTQRIIVVGNNGEMGNRIKELRKALKLTQPELAKLVGTTKNQLIKLESGDRRLSDHWAARLAPHLGVQPYELFMSQAPTGILRQVPIIGHIACGDWQEAIEHAEGSVPAVAGGPNVFALRAQGDSMNQLINDGGYLYVDPDDTDLIDGKIYVVMNGDNETTAKKFHSSPARLVPCSDNPVHHEISLGKDKYTVIGRVIGTYNAL